MSTVLAKFRLTSLASGRNEHYDRNPDTGRFEVVSAEENCIVKLSAIQGEPFGQATPSGAIDMIINNAAAAKVFREAWQAWVLNSNTQAKAPEFYVTFHLDEGKGALDLANH